MAFGDLLQSKDFPITVGTGSPAATSFTSNVTAGSLVTVTAASYPSALGSIASSPSQSWVVAGVINYGSNYIEIWSCIVAATGSLQVTLTASGGSDYVTATMQEWEGPFSSATGEDTGTDTGDAFFDSTSTTDTVTAAADALIVAALTTDQSSGTTSTPSNSFTERFNDPGSATYDSLAVASRVVSGGGSYSTSWTNSGAAGAQYAASVIAAYAKGAGGGSPALDDSDGFMLTTIQMPLTAVRLY